MKLTQFTFQQSTKMIMEAYEMGEGYLNAPHLVEHEVDPESGEPLDEVPPPYIGHGWFIKRFNEISPADIVNIDHLLETCPREQWDNTCIVFSRRASGKCRPCMPPPPTYIGWCLKKYKQ